ncbi:transcriptional regulator [Clostridium ljungdahlii]|nr:transcriptional regulator [Clostridium ljungdahlii]
MMVTDVRQKLMLFMRENNITQKELAKELNYNYEHFNAVMAGKYTVSNRLYQEIENLFRRYGYDKGLDDRGRL